MDLENKEKEKETKPLKQRIDFALRKNLDSKCNILKTIELELIDLKEQRNNLEQEIQSNEFNSDNINDEIKRLEID